MNLKPNYQWALKSKILEMVPIRYLFLQFTVNTHADTSVINTANIFFKSINTEQCLSDAVPVSDCRLTLQDLFFRRDDSFPEVKSDMI